MEAVRQCWRPEVFLKPLTAKFWKLTLQIIARYSKSVTLVTSVEHLESLLKSQGGSSVEDERRKLSPSPSQLFGTKSHFRSASDSSKIPVPETKTTDENLDGLTEPELILRLIWLYLDIVKLSKNFDSILDDLVWPVLK